MNLWYIKDAYTMHISSGDRGIWGKSLPQPSLWDKPEWVCRVGAIHVMHPDLALYTSLVLCSGSTLSHPNMMEPDITSERRSTAQHLMLCIIFTAPASQHLFMLAVLWIWRTDGVNTRETLEITDGQPVVWLNILVRITEMTWRMPLPISG